MLKLYEFFADFGRMGEVEGMFIEHDHIVDSKIGETVYLGEVLGKHSDIELDLKRENFSVKSDSQDFVKEMVQVLGYDISGFNPIKILREDDDEYDEFGDSKEDQDFFNDESIGFDSVKVEEENDGFRIIAERKTERKTWRFDQEDSIKDLVEVFKYLGHNSFYEEVC